MPLEWGEFPRTETDENKDTVNNESLDFILNKSEEEQRLVDFSEQELKKSREEILKAAEPAYRYAEDLISAIDLDKYPNFPDEREKNYEKIKIDPQHSWESDLWKRISAFAITWNSIKEKSWEITSDDEYTDDTIDKAVCYLMALWDATDAARRLAKFKSQRGIYENVVRNMEQHESSVA